MRIRKDTRMPWNASGNWLAPLLTASRSYDPSIAGLEAKDAIFRIYKDVRFSKGQNTV